MSLSIATDVLVIGAGPFGLSLAAHLRNVGADHCVVGRPMSFWREHMPGGMLLRSGIDWHLDAADVATIAAYVHETGAKQEDVQPLCLEFYLGYARWFQAKHAIEPVAFQVRALHGLADGRFRADCDGTSIEARNVVIATGFRDFAHVPPELVARVPEGSFGHTCDVVDLDRFAGQSVLIVGGRQSAFEWAGLLADAGAARVDVTYRHETPNFTESDWSWVGELMDRTERDPGWYRRLDEERRAELGKRFWAEGRLKLEPWLSPRVDVPAVRLWPRTNIAAAEACGEDQVAIELDNGARLKCDFVILATGYQVDLARVGLLAAGNLLSRIERHGGAPALGGDLQSSLPGLYFTSMAATADFGAFFAFTVSARCSTRLITRSLQARLG